MSKVSEDLEKTLKNRYRTNSLRDIMKKPFSALQQPVIWKTDQTFLFVSSKQLYIAKSQHYVANKFSIGLCIERLVIVAIYKMADVGTDLLQTGEVTSLWFVFKCLHHLLFICRSITV